ncbi:MAG: helix-turn-helix domain-containing protein [Bradymonadaceae bacterium]
MNLDKEVYTTFEVAKICNANITSIKNWIEQGELRAFRTPGGHYRIERKVLDDFLNRHGMPNPFTQRERRRILVIHPNNELIDHMRERFGSMHDYDAAGDALDALLKIGQWMPDAAVVDMRIEGLDVLGLCKKVRDHAEFRPVDLIVVHDQDQVFDESLRNAGADFTVHQAEGEDAVIEAVRRALL